jgi:hypothetical protein
LLSCSPETYRQKQRKKAARAVIKDESISWLCEAAMVDTNKQKKKQKEKDHSKHARSESYNFQDEEQFVYSAPAPVPEPCLFSHMLKLTLNLGFH